MATSRRARDSQGRTWVQTWDNVRGWIPAKAPRRTSQQKSGELESASLGSAGATRTERDAGRSWTQTWDDRYGWVPKTPPPLDWRGRGLIKHSTTAKQENHPSPSTRRHYENGRSWVQTWDDIHGWLPRRPSRSATRHSTRALAVGSAVKRKARKAGHASVKEGVRLKALPDETSSRASSSSPALPMSAATGEPLAESFARHDATVKLPRPDPEQAPSSSLMVPCACGGMNEECYRCGGLGLVPAGQQGLRLGPSVVVATGGSRSSHQPKVLRTKAVSKNVTREQGPVPESVPCPQCGRLVEKLSRHLSVFHNQSVRGAEIAEAWSALTRLKPASKAERAAPVRVKKQAPLGSTASDQRILREFKRRNRLRGLKPKFVSGGAIESNRRKH